MKAAPYTILVHGFLRSRHDMVLLAPRLRRLLPETSVHSFGYPSRKISLEEAAKRLADFVATTCKGEPVSFVGHSLGGLIVRALDQLPDPPAPLQRLVTLGTPHRGASIASFLSRSSLLKAIGGPVLFDLAAPALRTESNGLQVGCIIGATNTRLGFFPVFGRDNDGLVCVDEAVLPSCKDELRTFTFHGWFPFSPKSAHWAAIFLRHGSFSKGEDLDRATCLTPSSTAS